jgi:cysteine desulfurase
MLPYFTEVRQRQPQSPLRLGGRGRRVGAQAGRRPHRANQKEVIFTSGATESNNLAIKGAAEMYREKGNHVITCVTEHKAVIDTCKKLEKQGLRVTYLPVQKDGRISLDDLQAAITEKTILITIMTANNEIGVIHRSRRDQRDREGEGHSLPHRRRAGGRQVPFDVNALKADRVDQRPQDAARASARSTCGGAPARAAGRADQRQRTRTGGMRSGTLNVTGIVGLGKAAGCAAGHGEGHRAASRSATTQRRTAQRPRRDPINARWSTGCHLATDISFA